MQKRMLPLRARKPHLYGTRRLEAGDEYEAPVEQAIALVADRRADFIKGPPKPPKPAATPEPTPDSELPPSLVRTAPNIDLLRLEATQLGIDVDGRWGVPRLQYEIEQAKRR
jgi:hypothetical protein